MSLYDQVQCTGQPIAVVCVLHPCELSPAWSPDEEAAWVAEATKDAEEQIR